MKIEEFSGVRVVICDWRLVVMTIALAFTSKSVISPIVSVSHVSQNSSNLFDTQRKLKYRIAQIDDSITFRIPECERLDRIVVENASHGI